MRTWNWLVVAAIAIASPCLHAKEDSAGHAWTYSGADGPAHWGDLKSVAHLVHADQDGNLAVVAVLLEKGQASPLLRRIVEERASAKRERDGRG